MLSLIKNKKDWENLLIIVKNKVVSGMNIKITSIPNEYPCLVSSHIIRDINGFSANFDFVYKEQAKKLLNTCTQLNKKNENKNLSTSIES